MPKWSEWANGRTEVHNECVVWLKEKDRQGYGRVWDGARGRSVRAHRKSWEIANGPIPVGMCVLHKCDNPPCVKPEHLFLGTVSDNQLDAARKGRLIQPDGRGERNPSAILSNSMVRTARIMYLCAMSQREIARAMIVSRGAIADIVRGRKWKSLQWPEVLYGSEEASDAEA